MLSGKGRGDLVPASRAELLLPLASQLAGRPFAITADRGSYSVVAAEQVAALPDDASGVEAAVAGESVDLELSGSVVESTGLRLGASEALQVTVVDDRTSRVVTLGGEARELIDLGDAAHVELSITRADGATEQRSLWLVGSVDVDL